MIAVVTFKNEPKDSKFFLLRDDIAPIQLGVPISISNEIYMELLSITEVVDGLPQRKFNVDVISMKDTSPKITEPIQKVERIVTNEDKIAMMIMSEVDYFASIFNQLSSVLQLDDDRSIALGSIEIYKKVNNLKESVMKGDLDESAK